MWMVEVGVTAVVLLGEVDEMKVGVVAGLMCEMDVVMDVRAMVEKEEK